MLCFILLKGSVLSLKGPANVPQTRLNIFVRDYFQQRIYTHLVTVRQ